MSYKSRWTLAVEAEKESLPSHATYRSLEEFLLALHEAMRAAEDMEQNWIPGGMGYKPIWFFNEIADELERYIPKKRD